MVEIFRDLGDKKASEEEKSNILKKKTGEIKEKEYDNDFANDVS